MSGVYVWRWWLKCTAWRIGKLPSGRICFIKLIAMLPFPDSRYGIRGCVYSVWTAHGGTPYLRLFPLMGHGGWVMKVGSILLRAGRSNDTVIPSWTKARQSGFVGKLSLIDIGILILYTTTPSYVCSRTNHAIVCWDFDLSWTSNGPSSRLVAKLGTMP